MLRDDAKMASGRGSAAAKPAFFSPSTGRASRRGCLILWLCSFLICTSLPAAEFKWLSLGPLLGHVSDSEALLWVQSSESAQVTVRVSASANLDLSQTFVGPALTASTAFGGVTKLTSLQPSQRYYYVVELDGKPAMLPPYPSFMTAPPLGATQHLRFAFVSCSGYEPYDPAPGWADMGTRTNVDLLLMLGDSHYGNSPELEKQRKAYHGQRSSAGFREFTRRTPTYGIWDDHDFGPNDSDGTLPGKEGALRAFLEHWANPSYGEPDNPGVYFKFSRGDVDFFLTDDRYYRDPNTLSNSPTKTMLGPRQLAWLKTALAESKARVKVLAAGGEWQSHGTQDSWSSFTRERDEIFEWIRSHQIEGVILISGDRHFTAAYQTQKRFVEVTSGPIGGNTSDSRVTPEMFMNHNKGRFYCIYDVDTRAATPVLTIEIYRVSMGLEERRTFTWDEINGRQLIAPLPMTPSPNKKP